MPALRQPDCILAPFSGRCIVRRDAAPSQTGLIYIPDRAQTMPTLGVVVAVGDEDQAGLMGKRVLFPRMAGIGISIKGQPYLVSFAYSELLAVVESPDEEKVEFEEDMAYVE